MRRVLVPLLSNLSLTLRSPPNEGVSKGYPTRSATARGLGIFKLRHHSR